MARGYGRISIAGSLGEGFRLVARRPVSVLVWSGVSFVGGQALTWLAPADLTKSAPSSGDPTYASLLHRDLVSQVRLAAGAIGGIVLLIVLICAVWRAVLRPEDRRFAYLRTGMAEAGLALAGVLAFILILLPGLILIFVIQSVIQTGSAGPGWESSITLIFVLFALVIVPFICFWVVPRLALVGPASVAAEQLRISSAWHMTGGHVIAILVIGFCASLLAPLAAGLINLAVNWAAGYAPSNLRNSILASQFGSFVDMVVAVVSLSITTAPWARAYRDLAGPEVADTFG
jgi:hypothetical protein